MTPDQAVEITPVQQEGRTTPYTASIMRNWRLRVSPQDGTLRLTEDRALNRPPREQVFALPSAGRAGAVTTVCLANWEYFRASAGPRPYQCWRMLLLDRDGHVVGKGRLRDQPQARAAWPPELFAPLQRFGIRVVSENYPTPRALERAHPGAAPKTMILRWWQGTLLGLGTALVLLVIIGVIVYAATH